MKDKQKITHCIYFFTHQGSTYAINSLEPSDPIWRWRFWSTQAQVMACCLTTPSHYLNQCWLINSKVLWHSSEDDIIGIFEDTNQYTKLKITFLKSHYDLPGANELTEGLGQVKLPNRDFGKIVVQILWAALKNGEFWQANEKLWICWIMHIHNKQFISISTNYAINIWLCMSNIAVKVCVLVICAFCLYSFTWCAFWLYSVTCAFWLYSVTWCAFWLYSVTWCAFWLYVCILVV